MAMKNSGVTILAMIPVLMRTTDGVAIRITMTLIGVVFTVSSRPTVCTVSTVIIADAAASAHVHNRFISE